MLFGACILSIIMAFIAKRYEQTSESESSSRAWLQTVSAGYILSSIFLLCIIFFVFKIKPKSMSGNNLYQKILNEMTRIVGYPLPIYITIIILLFAGIQSLLYQDRLVKKHVANQYYTWNQTFTFLITVQIIMLIYLYLYKNSSYQYIIYIIGLFNAIFLGIMQVILQFYSTDG